MNQGRASIKFPPEWSIWTHFKAIRFLLSQTAPKLRHIIKFLKSICLKNYHRINYKIIIQSNISKEKIYLRGMGRREPIKRDACPTMLFLDGIDHQRSSSLRRNMITKSICGPWAAFCQTCSQACSQSKTTTLVQVLFAEEVCSKETVASRLALNTKVMK